MRLLCILLLLLATALAVSAQTDDLLKEYMQPWQLFPQIVQTIVWSIIYLAFYAAALIISLSYLKLFQGFDTELLYWIGALWLGGMVLNALVYHFTSVSWQAALLALPLLFGWSLFINTRSWADLTVQNGLRVALVVALVCAPYFGPTWRIVPPNAPGNGATREIQHRQAATESGRLHPGEYTVGQWLT